MHAQDVRVYIFDLHAFVRIGLDSDQDQKEPSQDGAVFIPHGGDW